MSLDDDVRKSVQNSAKTRQYSELLFKTSSVNMAWDEQSGDRSTVSSVVPPVDFLASNEEFHCPNDVKHRDSTKISSPSAFLPSVIYCRRTSATIYPEIPMGDISAKSSETEGSEEVSKGEENSLDGTQTTAEELKDEERLENEGNNPVDYLETEVFPVLLPCLEKMLFAAKENDVLKFQKSRFNGLDYLAELLWNRNPLHPERHTSHVPIFSIPFVQKHLEENPRPIIPQSYLWTRDQAAIVIQSAIRGYLVRCKPQVQELRQFWKTLAEEKKPA